MSIPTEMETNANTVTTVEWGDPIIPTQPTESVTHQNTFLGNSLSAFGGIHSVRPEIISVFDFVGDFNLLSTDSGPAVRSPKNNGVIDKLDLYVFGRKLMSSKLSSLLASVSGTGSLEDTIQLLYNDTKQQIDEAGIIIDKLALIIGLFNSAKARIGSLAPSTHAEANPWLANSVDSIIAVDDYGQKMRARLGNPSGGIIRNSFDLMGFHNANISNFSATKIYIQNLKDLQFLLYRPQSPTARINWSAHDPARQADNDPFEIMGTYSSDETDLEGLFLRELRHTSLDKPPAIAGLNRFTQYLEGMGVLDISRLCLSVLGSEIKWSLILGGKYATVATPSLEAFGMTNLSQSSIFATKGVPNRSAIGIIHNAPAYNKQKGDPDTATSPMTKSLATLARVLTSDEGEDRVGLSFESLYMSCNDSTQCPGGTFIPGTDLFLAGARAPYEPIDGVDTPLAGFTEFVGILNTSVDHLDNIIKAFVNIDGVRPGADVLDEAKLAIQIDSDVWNILYPGFGTTVLLPNGNWEGPDTLLHSPAGQDVLPAGNYPYTGYSVTTFTGQRAFWIARNTSAFCSIARTHAYTKRVIFTALCTYVYARSNSTRIRVMIAKDLGQSLGAPTVLPHTETLVGIRLSQGREAMFEAALTYIAGAIAMNVSNSILTPESVEQAWGSAAIGGLTYAVPPEVSVLYDHLGATDNTMFAHIHDLFERIMIGSAGLSDDPTIFTNWNGLLQDGTNRTRARFISPTTILYLLYEIYVQKIAYFSHQNTDFIRCETFVSQLDWSEFSDLESIPLDEEIPPADSTPGPVADQEEFQALASSLADVEESLAGEAASETEDMMNNLGEFDAIAQTIFDQGAIGDQELVVEMGMGVLTQPYGENLLDAASGLSSAGDMGVDEGFSNVGQEGMQGLQEFSMETSTDFIDFGFTVIF